MSHRDLERIARIVNVPEREMQPAVLDEHADIIRRQLSRPIEFSERRPGIGIRLQCACPLEMKTDFFFEVC